MILSPPRRLFLPHVMRLRHVLLWAAVIAAALPLWGCKEDVTAVLGTDMPYTLYGVLSPQLDSQWVRVFPIEDRLEPAADAQLDAVFTSRDLTTGEEFVWRDSVIMDAFGQHAHAFWAPFRAEYGHTYRIVVRRSDGLETSVETTVPPETHVVIQPPESQPTRVLAPVLIEGAAPRLLRIEVVYSVGFLPAGSGGLQSDNVIVPYDGRQRQVSEGFVVPINLSKDVDAVRDSLQRRTERPVDRAVGILLNRLTLRVIVAGEDWNPPGGVFDPEVLVQPGVLSNVENGFGYVVAGYRHEITWTPPDEVVAASGFRVGRMVPEQLARASRHARMAHVRDARLAQP